MDWFQLDMPRAVPAEIRPHLKNLAGCIVSSDGRHVFAGLNSAWLVSNTLQFYGLKPVSVKQPDWMRFEGHRLPVPRIPDMRETVSGYGEPWPSYLLPWQTDLLETRAHRPSVFLWWAPGAGKTLASLAWAMLDPGRILFITRSGARRTIVTDTKRFTTASYFTLEGEKGAPSALPDVRLVVTGWDTLPAHVERITEWGPVTVVFDEIHRAKSYRRKVAIPKRDAAGSAIFREDGKIANDFLYRDNMTAAAKQISISPSVRRRLGATATPIKDRIRDFWAQLDLIEPEMWGRSFYDFATRYCNAKDGIFGGKDTSGRSPEQFITGELAQRLAFTVHHVPYAVTHKNLPPKRRMVTYIPRDQLLRDEGAAARKAIAASDREGATMWMKAHARLAAAAERKRNYVAEVVADQLGSSGKIVVVTGLRESCERLHETIAKKVAGVKTWWGHGDTSIKARDQIQEEYMAHPGPCVLVGTMQTWGESLNLQDTDLSLAAMLPFTPGEVMQYEGRFSRQGQKRPCTIHYLIAEGTYDEHVAQVLIDKLPSIEKLEGEGGALDGFRKAIGGVADEAALVESVFSKITAGTYELDEEDHR